jgi:hypothetical protein
MAFKYYKDANNKVYAFEADGSQDAYIKPGLISITNAQADALRATPVAAPTVISMRQARLALHQRGYLSQVETLVSGMTEDAKITWNYATEVRREHPLVAAIAAALNLTSQQLDDLFTLGASL